MPVKISQHAANQILRAEQSVDKQGKPVTETNAASKKVHRNSAESSMSGIVWSAVVEKFSEMAQEIAGGKANTAKESEGASLAAPQALIKPSSLANSVVVGPQSSDTSSDNEETDLPASSSQHASESPAAISLPSEMAELDAAKAVLTDDSESGLTLTSKSAEDASQDLQGSGSSGTLDDAAPIKALKRRSKSFTAISIMKKPSKDLAPTNDNADGSSFRSGKYDVIKLKRGRTVRVQSHHANVHVEGDYAAFLRKATGGDEDRKGEGDASSLKSGKSNRSGKSAWSTKSGVENGCFR